MASHKAQEAAKERERELLVKDLSSLGTYGRKVANSYSEYVSMLESDSSSDVIPKTVAIRMLTTLSDSIISMCEAARSVSTFIKLSGAGGGGDMGQLVAGGTTRPPNMDSRVPRGEMRSMSSPSRAGSIVTGTSRRLTPAEIRKRRQRAGAAPPATPGGDRPEGTKVLHQELALPLLLSTGSALTPAGPWATLVKRYRSDVAEINLHFKTPLLREFCEMPSQWEPKIRVKYAMDWNPVSLVEQMTLFTT